MLEVYQRQDVLDQPVGGITVRRVREASDEEDAFARFERATQVLRTVDVPKDVNLESWQLVQQDLALLFGHDERGVRHPRKRQLLVVILSGSHES